MSIRDTTPTNLFMLHERSPYHPSLFVFYYHIGTRLPQGILLIGPHRAFPPGSPQPLPDLEHPHLPWRLRPDPEALEVAQEGRLTVWESDSV